MTWWSRLTKLTRSSPASPPSADVGARYLTQRTEQYFEPAVRKRGADSARSGDVVACRGGELSLAATVHGSRLYDVSAQVLEPGAIAVACSCAYFEARGYCKHLWAVFLQAEQRGLLREVGGGSDPIELVDLDDVQADADLQEDDFADPSELPGTSGAFLLEHPYGFAPNVSQPATWQELLDDARARRRYTDAESAKRRLELAYVLPQGATDSQVLTVHIWQPGSASGDGEWRPAVFRQEHLELISEPVERELYALLGVKPSPVAAWPPPPPPLPAGVVRVPGSHAVDLLRRLCATGRCRVGGTDRPPLTWAGDTPWHFQLELVEDQIGTTSRSGRRAARRGSPYAVRGLLVRQDELRPVADAQYLTRDVAVLDGAAAPCSTEHARPWFRALLERTFVPVPLEELETFLRQYHQLEAAPPLRLPPSLTLTEREIAPELSLDVQAPDRSSQGLPCAASAVYGSEKVPLGAYGARVVAFEERSVYPRRLELEEQARATLADLGFRGPLLESPAGHPCWRPGELRLAKKRLAAAVEALTTAGWRVRAQGKEYRRAGEFSIEVTTGLDWLDLQGGATFDGIYLGLPELLRAIARQERTVVLDDGTLGLLPEEWLERWRFAADVAPAKSGAPDGQVRLRRAHAGLVDALLDTVEQASWDEAFASLRRELRSFGELEPAPAPDGFVGELRPYQAEGLAWLELLARLGFGGCLADDMGLGKTIQVLALLLARSATPGPADRKRGTGRQRATRPSLIVVPRSVVHNWIDEARRFAPALRLLPHVGSQRDRELRGLTARDVVVTSYGTLLRDLEPLQRIEFDCIVLDEAQAIKTAGTQTAKAVRLVQGSVRLALSGTPVENHLGELWSLMDFLNPGLLGRAARWPRGAARASEGKPGPLLARTVRPFILRRTKAAVAKDLPERSEETIRVELDRAERRRYDDLLRYYQARVSQRVALAGVARSTPLLLEALLRLRQAACHPGLVDPTQCDQPSAKLQVLLDRLAGIEAEGHKALVFSQFTSLLAIVRNRLDARGASYEYLDGKTRNRPARVARFQNDATVRLFLISLKAGGVGLNLTAADYVFILDPWWNPAVEAQAIDRTHRIGQSRRVFAYRLIARDTVEERVAELQQTKRKLVESILGETSGLAGKLTRKDFELLLG